MPHSLSRAHVRATFLLRIAACAWGAGVQQDLYNNSAIAGTPFSSAIVLSNPDDTLTLAWPAASNVASVEVSGQLVYPVDGAYSFSCAFDDLSVAFVWLNDHQICNSGAYNNSASSTDGTAVYPIYGRVGKPDVLRIQALPKPATASS